LGRRHQAWYSIIYPAGWPSTGSSCQVAHGDPRRDPSSPWGEKKRLGRARAGFSGTTSATRPTLHLRQGPHNTCSTARWPTPSTVGTRALCPPPLPARPAATGAGRQAFSSTASVYRFSTPGQSTTDHHACRLGQAEKHNADKRDTPAATQARRHVRPTRVSRQGQTAAPPPGAPTRTRPPPPPPPPPRAPHQRTSTYSGRRFWYCT